MSEINAQKHIEEIFAAAKKLMEARRQLAVAKLDAAEAETVLTRLNGSTSLDLSNFEDTRFFECEGDQKIRMDFGDEPEPGSTSDKCGAIIGYHSWQIPRGAKRPDDPPMCHGCASALKKKNAKPATAEPATTTVTAATERQAAALDEDQPF